MEEVNWFGEQFFVRATEVNIVAMKKASFVVEAEAKRLLSTGGYTGGRYYPSSPGEPPRLRQGILRASVATELVKNVGFIEGWVGSHLGKIRQGMAAHGITATKSGVEYGYFLEVGTRFMQKRPWLRPALARSRRTISKIFQMANGK